MSSLENLGAEELHCDGCNFVTTSHSSLWEHMAVVHFGKKPYKCEKCDFTAEYRSSLVLHMKAHESKEQNCRLCDHVAVSEESLEMHNRTFHNIRSGAAAWRCDQCSFATGSISRSNVHVRERHQSDEEVVENIIITDVGSLGGFGDRGLLV